MKRTALWLLLACLAAALIAGGCTTRYAAEQYTLQHATPEPVTPAPTEIPTPEPTPTPAPTPSPTPTPCPHLTWTDGVCDGCGAVCAHENWTEGRCAVCGMACPHPAHDGKTRLCTRCGQPVPHDFVKNVCTLCGEEPDFLEENLALELFDPCDHAGTVEKVEYTTRAYYAEGYGMDPEGIKKTLYVYLPYNYDPEEKYDVLILLHGIECTEKYWLMEKREYQPMGIEEVLTPNLLDNLIDQGYCRPVIVVTPTFYVDSADFSNYLRRRDQPRFQTEVREDILPMIAEKYATWAEGNTLEDITEARAHFGIAGLSMGSIYIYTSFLTESRDVFGWFGCFSGSDGYMDSLAKELRSGPNSQYPIYYFYNSVGQRDNYYYLHLGQYTDLMDMTDVFTEGENTAFSVIKDVGHQYAAWSTGLRNFLTVAFSTVEQ